MAQPRSDLPADLVARRDALIALQQWSLDGRMALRSVETGFSGAIAWQQSADHIEARFHGPLGAGAFNLSGTAEALLVETGDGSVYVYDDPERMLHEQFGWTIPVAVMRYWLLGVSAPGSPAVEQLNDEGQLALLEQHGWSVSYERYADFGSWQMPRRIEMSNTDVRIRLAIHQWSLEPN